MPTAVLEMVLCYEVCLYAFGVGVQEIVSSLNWQYTKLSEMLFYLQSVAALADALVFCKTTEWPTSNCARQHLKTKPNFVEESEKSC